MNWIVAVMACGMVLAVALPGECIEDETLDLGFRLELGPLIYKEDPVNRISESSIYGGMLASIGGRKPVYWEMSGRYAASPVPVCYPAYDNETDSWRLRGDYPGVKDYIIEMRGLLGAYYPRRGDFSAMLYSGIGYRLWKNENAYDREVTYVYLPVGAEIRKEVPHKGCAWGVRAEFDALLSGYVDSFFNDLDPANENARNDLKTGYGFQLSAFVESTGDGLKVRLEPFVRFWHIGRSQSDEVFVAGAGNTTVREPKNYTVFTGLAISLRW